MCGTVKQMVLRRKYVNTIDLNNHFYFFNAVFRCDAVAICHHKCTLASFHLLAFARYADDFVDTSSSQERDDHSFRIPWVERDSYID